MILIDRPKGFHREQFHEQECVVVPVERFATLLDVQRGKALVLLYEREPGDNGLLEVDLDLVSKQYQ